MPEVLSDAGPRTGHPVVQTTEKAGQTRATHRSARRGTRAARHDAGRRRAGI